MRYPASVVVLALLLAGCEKSSAPPPPRVPAIDPHAARTTVAAHPILAGMAGNWGQVGQVIVSVIPQSDGSAMLQVPQPTEGWRIEIRNGRVQSGRIHYEQYHYALDAPAHRLDGMRCDVVLEPIPAMRDMAKLTVTTEEQETTVRTISRLQ